MRVSVRRSFSFPRRHLPIPLEQLRDARAFGDVGGEVVGGEDGFVVGAVGFAERGVHGGFVVEVGEAFESGNWERASKMPCAVCSIAAFCASVGVHHGKLLYTIVLL